MQSRTKASREEMFRSLGMLDSVQTRVVSLLDCRCDDFKTKSIIDGIISSIEEVKGVFETVAVKAKK